MDTTRNELDDRRTVLYNDNDNDYLPSLALAKLIEQSQTRFERAALTEGRQTAFSPVPVTAMFGFR